LTTGDSTASVQIRDTLRDVSLDLVNMVQSDTRVSTWPANAQASATATPSTVPGGQTGGSLMYAHGQLDWQLEGVSQDAGWVALALPDGPGVYHVQDDGSLFAFAGGGRGIRISPAHAPIVASVLSCAKGGGVVAVYVRTSEPVTKAAGALTLEYGAAGTACAM